MTEAKLTCSFEPGKTVGKMTFSIDGEITVSGTPSKFTGESVDSKGKVTKFSDADLDSKETIGLIAKTGQGIFSSCATEKSIQDMKKDTERLNEWIRFHRAPGLEV